MQKTRSLSIILTIALLLVACAPKPDPQVEKGVFHSDCLGKDMNICVFLPKEYDGNKRFPVLYFLPDGGGGATTATGVYQCGDYANELTGEGKIEPMLIVSTAMDQSFGANTSETAERFDTQSGKSFTKGPYEDYVINDLIPYIDATYQTLAARESRYIGGYSMGGFAALHIAFRHPELFSRVGGHSPSLFTGDFPDKTISDWLYPDKATRSERDPLLLAGSRDLEGLSVYLDTGETDVNVEGCEALYETLKSKGIPAEFHLLPGTHSREYCNAYMKDYLTFYSGNKQ